MTATRTPEQRDALLDAILEYFDVPKATRVVSLRLAAPAGGPWTLDLEVAGPAVAEAVLSAALGVEIPVVALAEADSKRIYGR